MLIAFSAVVTVAAFGVTARAVASADDKPTIKSAVLLDANRNQRIAGRMPLSGNETVDLTALRTRELSVQALTSNKVGSVRFEVNGRTTRVENHFPFVLNGDAADGTDFLPWKPAAGKHSVVITPYSGNDAKGKAGDAVRLTVTIVTPSATPPTKPPTPTTPANSTPPASPTTAPKPAQPPTTGGPRAGAGIGGPDWTSGQIAPTKGGRHLYVATDGSDRNDGLSTAKPLRNLQAAADRVQAGDTVIVRGGTYEATNKFAVLNITRSGTKEKPITFAAHPNEKPVITATEWYGIHVQAAHVVIAGFTVKGRADQLTEQQKAAVRRGDASDPKAQTSCIAAFALDSVPASRRPHHVTFHGNTAAHCPQAGIGSMNADYITLAYNVSHDNAKWSPYGASGLGTMTSWNSDSYTGYKNFIVGNISYNNANYVKCLCSNKTKITDGNGIIIDSGRLVGYRGRTLIQNNIVYNNGGRGINVFKSDHVDVINNTTYHNAGTDGINDEIAAVQADDVKVLNNIAVSRPGKDKLAAGASAATRVTFRHNLLDGPFKTPQDPNLRTGNPLFVNPSNGDFRLTAKSAAIDSGLGELPAGTLRTDATREVRSGAMDRGAYEFRG